MLVDFPDVITPAGKEEEEKGLGSRALEYHLLHGLQASAVLTLGTP